MRRLFLGLSVVALLVACSSQIAEFWRPISEPNLLMSPQKAQSKLDFDLSQCKCGIFPENVPPSDQIAFQPDKQRFAETSVTVTENRSGDCIMRPSLVVAECMRARGWEVTKCSGRMPLAGGGALCAGATVDQ
ncbi:MAG: hypothetical protein PHY92_02080 [Alphaproteobacteria bacterium]|nr:hypothetical protein [Alphaproteobacteria bacterium]